MLSDERLEYLVAFSCRPETTELARELIAARAEVERLRDDRDYWKEQSAIEGGRNIDLYAKHPELLPELTPEEKAACDSVSLDIEKMFDECRAEEAELVSLRAECERLRGAWVEGPPKEGGDYWIERNGSIEATNWSANVCGAFCGRSFWEIAILPEEVARHAALTPPTKE